MNTEQQPRVPQSVNDAIITAFNNHGFTHENNYGFPATPTPKEVVLGDFVDARTIDRLGTVAVWSTDPAASEAQRQAQIDFWAKVEDVEVA
jgi:hypothetical protein